jgi:hypothetical protein
MLDQVAIVQRRSRRTMAVGELRFDTGVRKEDSVGVDFQ